MENVKIKMNKSCIIAVICMIFLFCACTNKKEDVKHTSSIGEYLYLDKYNCLHTDKNCVMLLIGGGTEYETNTNYPVEFIKTDRITTLDGYKFCSDCFTNALYEQLQNIVQQRNEQIEKQDSLNKDLGNEIQESLDGVKRIN